MKNFIYLTLLLSSSLSWGVVFSNTSEAPRSIIAIGGERGGMCTGTIVGMNPPTVITARHCALKNMIIFMTVHPDKVIQADFNEKEFSVERTMLPGDMAILVYPQNSAPIFKERLGNEDVMKVSMSSPAQGEKITACGYGSSDPRRGYPNGAGFKRCGMNHAFVSEAKGKGKAKHIVEMINANLVEYEAGTRIAIGRVLADGKYDKDMTLSVLQQGDSGGPGFITTASGERAIAGINSYTVFDEDNVVVSVLWSLAHPWSHTLLQTAIQNGADIQLIN